MERYKEKCKQISEQIEPREEFMKNLKTNINKKIEERTIKHKYQLSKIAVVFFAVTLVSTGAFGKDFSSWISKIFSNTDPSTQIAIEHGYIQNVEGEYIEHQGIGIKVNSIVIDDNKMNIVFDIKGNIDGKIMPNEIYLADLNNKQEYDIENIKVLNSSYETEFNSIDKNNHTLIVNISNIDSKFKEVKKIQFILDKLYIIQNNNLNNCIDAKWKFSIDVDNNIFKNSLANVNKYVISENEYLENYEINMTNTGLNVELQFKENLFEKLVELDRKDIILLKEYNEEYLCKDFSQISNNSIKITFPITKYENLNNFNILLKLQNENIIFNIQREES